MANNQNNVDQEAAERINLEAAVLAIYSYVYTQGQRADIYARMVEVLEPHGIDEGNIDKVRRVVTRHGGEAPLAIIAEGFNFAWDEVGVPEPLAKDAINLMKQEEIIVQCGRGYGKAIVLTRAEFDLFENHYRAEAIGVDQEEEAEEAREVAEEELAQDAEPDVIEPDIEPQEFEAEPNPPDLFDEVLADQQQNAEVVEQDVDMNPAQLLRVLNDAGDTFLNILESLQRDVAGPLLLAQKAVRKIQEDMEAQPNGDVEELQAEIDRLKQELERAQMVAWQ